MARIEAARQQSDDAKERMSAAGKSQEQIDAELDRQHAKAMEHFGVYAAPTHRLKSM